MTIPYRFVKQELSSREKRVKRLKKIKYETARALTHPMEREAIAIVRFALEFEIIAEAKCCTECGSTDTLNYHHDDYEFPLAVRALCISCHRKWHKENEPLNVNWERRPEYQRRMISEKTLLRLLNNS